MPYIVATAAAHMPSSCWGRYRRVAVLEIEAGLPAGYWPAMISDRARGVVRVVETWESRNVGKTNRCAYRRAMAEAREMAEALNAREEAERETAVSRAVDEHCRAIQARGRA